MTPNMRLLVYGSCLAGALLLGAVVIAAVNRWRRRGQATLTADSQLAEFRSLYEAGAISQEEFERLRAHLIGRIRPPSPGPAPGPNQGPPSAGPPQDAPGPG